ncbi:MAG: hypothetical protein KAH01_02420, partial [Caldisericia bacterium]|nr:hypothetical protein [Caldisericia bacterium]
GGPTLSIHGKQTMIEIRVEIGENIYGEIRMWDYETMHWITKDNQKKGSAISGGLRGVKTPNDPSTDLPYPDPSVPYDASWDKATCEANGYFFCPLANACLNKAHNSSSEVEDLNSEDYKDIVIFPISYKATKKVPIFERERLMRESIILSVYSLTVIKTKWYQSGVFKAVLFVFAIIITVVAPYLAGVAWKAIITSVVKMAIIAAVSGVILQMIDNPFIAAILVVVLAVYTMNPELASMSFEQMALIGMEAANTYVAKYYAQKMEEIQKEFEEFKEKMKAAEEELEDLQEEVGILRNDATEWVKQIAQFPPVESAEDSLSRTTDVNNAIIDDVDNMTDVTLLLPAMTTKQ